MFFVGIYNIIADGLKPSEQECHPNSSTTDCKPCSNNNEICERSKAWPLNGQELLDDFFSRTHHLSTSVERPRRLLSSLKSKTQAVYDTDVVMMSVFEGVRFNICTIGSYSRLIERV